MERYPISRKKSLDNAWVPPSGKSMPIPAFKEARNSFRYKKSAESVISLDAARPASQCSESRHSSVSAFRKTKTTNVESRLTTTKTTSTCGKKPMALTGEVLESIAELFSKFQKANRSIDASPEKLAGKSRMTKEEKPLTPGETSTVLQELIESMWSNQELIVKAIRQQKIPSKHELNQRKNEKNNATKGGSDGENNFSALSKETKKSSLKVKRESDSSKMLKGSEVDIKDAVRSLHGGIIKMDARIGDMRAQCMRLQKITDETKIESARFIQILEETCSSNEKAAKFRSVIDADKQKMENRLKEEIDAIDELWKTLRDFSLDRPNEFSRGKIGHMADMLNKVTPPGQSTDEFETKSATIPEESVNPTPELSPRKQDQNRNSENPCLIYAEIQRNRKNYFYLDAEMQKVGDMDGTHDATSSESTGSEKAAEKQQF